MTIEQRIPLTGRRAAREAAPETDREADRTRAPGRDRSRGGAGPDVIR
ncbi:hypothetical protein ABT084_15390 [Streptomyces sp. NPDC002138]